MQNKTFIVIPARNEEKHIAKVLEKARKYSKNIIVIDDGSSDKTSEIAKKAGVIVLKHIVNLGKGAALKTGCDYAIKKGANKIVVLDADGQHDADLIPLFIKALKNNDIVFGYRKFNKRMPLVFRFGNSFINKITYLLFRIKVRDTQCGFRGFTSSAYKKIRWKANDYAMESEMIANAGKHNLKYVEVPITTIYSDKYKGTTIFDGIKIVAKMIIWRLVR